MADPVPLTERQTARLLERWLLWQGAQQAAGAAAQAAQAAQARYADELAAVAEVPKGARVHLDVVARTLTVAPGEEPPA